MKTVSHKRHQDVRFDSRFELVKNGADFQVAFEVLEGLFDFGELQVEAPQFGWVRVEHVSA